MTLLPVRSAQRSSFAISLRGNIGSRIADQEGSLRQKCSLQQHFRHQILGVSLTNNHSSKYGILQPVETNAPFDVRL